MYAIGAPSGPYGLITRGGSKWIMNADGSVSVTIGKEAKGITITGTKPATVAGAGTSAGTFWSIVAPNGGDSSGAAGGAGGSISETTGNAGVSFSGGARGGDRTIALGTGTGTAPSNQGTSGQFYIQLTDAAGTARTALNSPFNVSGAGVGFFNAAIYNSAGRDTLVRLARLGANSFTPSTPTTGTSIGMSSEILWAFGTNATTGEVISFYGNAQTDATANNVNTLIAIDGEAEFNTGGSMTIANAQGVHGGATADSGFVGTVTLGIGVSATAENDSAGTFTTSHSLDALVRNTTSGVMTTARGLHVLVQNTGAGTISTGVGVNVAAMGNSGGGTFTNAISAILARQTVGTTASASLVIGALSLAAGGPYGIYQQSTDTNYFAGKIGLGTLTAPVAQLDVVFTSTATSGAVYGIQEVATLNPSAGSSATLYGLHFTTTIQGGSNALSGIQWEMRLDMNNQNTGTLADMRCLDASPTNAGAANTVTSLRAIQGTPANTGTGTLTNTYGGYFSVTNSSTGTITGGYGGRFAAHVNSGGGTFTSAIGAAFDHQTVGSTNISILIGANSQPGGTWGIYQQSGDNNSLLGSLAVATNTAAAAGTGLRVGGATIAQTNIATFTNTGGVTDGYLSGLRMSPTYDGAFTVTRHNYLDLNNPLLTNSAVLTDAAVMRFDAAIGTHKALAANGVVATTITSLGPTGAGTTIAGWLKINVNGTLRYIPCW